MGLAGQCLWRGCAEPGVRSLRHLHASGAAERRRAHHRSNRPEPVHLSVVRAGRAQERQHRAACQLRWRRHDAPAGDARAAAVSPANDQHQRQDRVGDPRASERRGASVDGHGRAHHVPGGGDALPRQRHRHALGLLPVRSGDRGARPIHHLHLHADDGRRRSHAGHGHVRDRAAGGHRHGPFRGVRGRRHRIARAARAREPHDRRPLRSPPAHRGHRLRERRHHRRRDPHPVSAMVLRRLPRSAAPAAGVSDHRQSRRPARERPRVSRRVRPARARRQRQLPGSRGALLQLRLRTRPLRVAGHGNRVSRRRAPPGADSTG